MLGNGSQLSLDRWLPEETKLGNEIINWREMMEIPSISKM